MLLIGSYNKLKCFELGYFLQSNDIDYKTCIDIGDGIIVNELTSADGGDYTINSVMKSYGYGSLYNIDCISDDSGIEIFSLPGILGIDSSLYNSGDISRCTAVLNSLIGKSRESCFKCVISYYDGGISVKYFSGIIYGRIRNDITELDSNNYADIFIPNGYDKCLSDIDISERLLISHRGIALSKFLSYYKTGDFSYVDGDVLYTAGILDSKVLYTTN